MCLGLVVRGIHEGACAWWKVRVKGYRVRRSLVGLGLGSRAHAHVDSQSPATGYWARCVLSARGRGCQVRVRVTVCLALW